jgi:hypothetical protein
VNLWFVGEFREEEKEFRTDLMKPASCCINFWTNVFVTLLYLIFVKKNTTPCIRLLPTNCTRQFVGNALVYIICAGDVNN